VEKWKISEVPQGVPQLHPQMNMDIAGTSSRLDGCIISGMGQQTGQKAKNNVERE
jgi:hypothetical protein